MSFKTKYWHIYFHIIIYRESNHTKNKYLTFLIVFWKQVLCSSIEAWMNSSMWSFKSSMKVASSFFFFLHEVGFWSALLFCVSISTHREYCKTKNHKPFSRPLEVIKGNDCVERKTRKKDIRTIKINEFKCLSGRFLLKNGH